MLVSLNRSEETHLLAPRTPVRKAAAALCVAIVLTLAACSKGSGGTTTTSSGSGSHSAAFNKACQALGTDLVAVGGGGADRPNAIARLVPKLRHDADLFAAAGDQKDATRVRAFATALNAVRSAELGNGNLKTAQDAVQRASAQLPSC